MMTPNYKEIEDKKIEAVNHLCQDPCIEEFGKATADMIAHVERIRDRLHDIGFTTDYHTELHQNASDAYDYMDDLSRKLRRVKGLLNLNDIASIGKDMREEKSPMRFIGEQSA